MNETKTAMPPVTSRSEWLDRRLALLAQEKELTKHYDRINAERRRLPMVKLAKEYTFEGTEGKQTLADLFEGRKQLIVYHFMFDPEWDKGCSGCTGFVDALGDLSMLNDRNTNFVLISRAPLEKLLKYGSERGWDRPWYSSFGSDFNYDFHVTLDPAVAPPEYNFRPAPQIEGEEHGISVFFRDGEDIYHTYSTYARGTENTTDTYRLLDLTPYGRQEDFEDSPEGWPQRPTYG
jgi:predicted dithiol-disulfide oxidoreductase (DUF899 family)